MPTILAMAHAQFPLPTMLTRLAIIGLSSGLLVFAGFRPRFQLVWIWLVDFRFMRPLPFPSPAVMDGTPKPHDFIVEGCSVGLYGPCLPRHSSWYGWKVPARGSSTRSHPCVSTYPSSPPTFSIPPCTSPKIGENARTRHCPPHGFRPAASPSS